ncbi:G-protein coupled receptor 4-like isoform X1 [Mixophyes fleayi]|uniref:G-protein coupled receptor 4-like isoform X1 n=1 Tax=Mixophyes fleayi TaxID=3061075 RepID=UPI003F4DF148
MSVRGMKLPRSFGVLDVCDPAEVSRPLGSFLVMWWQRSQNDSSMACSTVCDYAAKYEATLFPIIYGLVFIVGLVGNLAAIGVIYQHVKRENVLGVYLANLCASDLMYIFTLPVWMAYTAKDDWLFGALSCKIVGFFFNANLYTTIAFLSCIAADRYIATVFPFRAKVLRTMRGALIVCVVVWLIILGTHSVFLGRDELFNSSQNVKLCYEKYPMEQWMARVNYFRIFVVFLIPLVLLVVSYCSVVRVVHRSRGLEKEQKRKIIGLLMCMTGIFVICYLPYHIVLFIRSYISDRNMCTCDIENKVRPAYRITFSLTSLSSALDPFINIFVSESIKQDLLKEVRAVWTGFRSLRHPRTSLRLSSKINDYNTVTNQVENDLLVEKKEETVI